MSACEVTARVIGHGSPPIPEISSARRDPRCARRGRRVTHTQGWRVPAVRHERFNSPVRIHAPINREGAHVPLTQTQLAIAVADRAEIPRAEAKRVLGALEEVVLEELSNAQKVRVVGLVQLTVRVKPAQKKRQGRNPATGEAITIAAKPASVDLRARPLAKAKTALSVQKARRRLAAA